jgi:hypothetical protein
MSSNVFEEIKVSYDAARNRVTCSSMDVVLYHAHPGAPNAVRWVVGEAPPKASQMLILWENGCPFSLFGIGRSEGFGSLIGTGLARETGVFKYSIVFVNDSGDIICGIDPVIVDQPRP